MQDATPAGEHDGPVVAHDAVLTGEQIDPTVVLWDETMVGEQIGLVIVEPQQIVNDLQQSQQQVSRWMSPEVEYDVVQTLISWRDISQIDCDMMKDLVQRRCSLHH